MMNRWSYLFIGILLLIGMMALRKYLILQATGSEVPSSGISSSGVTSSGVSVSGVPTSGVPSGNSSGSSGSIPISIPSASQFPSSVPQIPQSQSSFPVATGNSVPQPPPGIDPTTQQHILPSGGREDIEQIGSITVSQTQAYTGDDINFTVTIKNTTPYKKFVRQLCWQSNEGNFGCSPGFNLDPGQVFSISNSGRFTSSGTKSVWVTWTQDNTNFLTPVNNTPVIVHIL